MMPSLKFQKIIIAFLVIALCPFSAYAAKGKKAMIVTADPRASAAALEVLQGGGSAADAAIAAQWVLNVVEPQSSGIGGGGFFLYYDAQTKQIHALDGREKAPSEANEKMFYDEYGELYPFYPDRISGGLPVGVPGTLKLMHDVYGRFSSKRFSFAELFIPAIDYASRGTQVSPRLARHLEQEKERLKLFPESAWVFLDKDQNALKAGDIIFQPDLARTFRLIQQQGIDVFYEGEIAKDIVKAVREAPFHPGPMQEEDLFYYKVIERSPVHGLYRGHDIFSMGPPSSGGSTIIEALNILELYDLGLEGYNDTGLHLFSEAQKLAFQDRNEYLGDPDYSKIPLQKLTSKDFAKERAEVIQKDKAMPTTQAATRPLNLEGMHTSHISIVDDQGNVVSFTTTIESVFGSAMVVPKRGILLNNELTDFNATPRNFEDKLHPNAPESEKRPRSSMTPTIVFKDGKPLLVVGSPGGSTIIGTVLNIIVNVIDYGLSLSEAMSAARIINRDGPVEMETKLFEDDDLRRKLERRGHPVIHRPVIGNAQAIYFDHRKDEIVGASDPRGEGHALGY